MNKKWFAAFCMLCACTSLVGVSVQSYLLGYQDGYNAYQPRAITKTVQLPPVITHEVQAIYVDKPIEIEKIVYQDKIRFQKLTDFASLEELQAFLAQDDTNEWLILTASSSGTVQFDGACEDYAFQLRDRASQIGKRLETELLTRSEYVEYYGDTGGLGVNDKHMVNKAVIGNDVYLVEPQSDKVWKVVELD